MFKLLEKVTPDLILLDVEMPGIHGYQAIKTLKSNEEHKKIPVIFLSAMDDEDSELEGFELGAVDYIHKPFVKALLIRRIEAQILLSEKRKELLKMKNELLVSINTVINTIDASIESENLNEIKNNLKQAKPEAMSILQFINELK
jgi:putative two-component system response regulator